MSPNYVSTRLRRQVTERASGRCEYCLISAVDAFFPHEADHIIAEKHGGATTIDNLALACFDCNRFKGSDIASLDPDTGELVALFNPRTEGWNEHFFAGRRSYRSFDSLRSGNGASVTTEPAGEG